MNKKNNHFDLQRFGAGKNVNTTAGYTDAESGTVTAYLEGAGLSDEMRTYYADYLIDLPPFLGMACFCANWS